MEQRHYVGVDLHRHRSVLVQVDEAGETLATTHMENDPAVLAAELTRMGEHPDVVLEACYGWYWAADVAAECGATVHLAHPLGNNWGNRRVKNDERDAADLVDLLRLGRLAEAWVAPPELRELRELVRYRAKLVHLRTSCKAQVHAVLAKEGVRVTATDLFGPSGRVFLDECGIGETYAVRVTSLLKILEVLDWEIDRLAERIAVWLADDAGYWAIQAIPGIGPVLAAVFVAEIGDIGRFPSARHLCSWAGLTPTHHESDTKVRRGHITKQGSRLVRWAAVEAAARQQHPNPISDHRRRVGDRRGKNVGRVAAARKLLTLVFYGLRDGTIRCLAETAG